MLRFQIVVVAVSLWLAACSIEVNGIVIRETWTPMPTPAVQATRVPTTSTTVPRVVVPGWVLTVELDGATAPVNAVYDDANHLYVAQRDGVVLRYRGGQPSVLARSFYNPEGMVWLQGSLAILSRGRLDALQDWNGDGEPERITPWADELPSRDGPAAALATDGSRYLYFGIGTDCSTCRGTENLRGSILVLDLRTGRIPVFARGTGSIHGLAWLEGSNPALLLASSGGIDGSPGRIVLVRQGADLGWPSCLVPDPEACGKGDEVLLRLDNGRVPTGLVVEKQENRLLLLFGSYAPGQPHSGKISSVMLSEDGHKESDVQDVVVGLSQPLGFVRSPQGVLVVDVELGRIYALKMP